MRQFLLLPALLLLFTSCDLYPQDVYEKQYVVDAWLVAMEPMPDIRLSRTSSIEEVFDINERGVTDALLSIHMLGNEGEIEYTAVYTHKNNGIYTQLGELHIVQPNKIYQLDITTYSGQIIRAFTTIPDTFSVITLNATSLPYQGIEQFTLELTRSVNPSRQSYYVFSGETLDPEFAELTPFYANFEDDREDFLIVSSGIINEANSRTSGSDIVELIYPWIGIAFYGPTRISAAAVDDNAFDFIRSAGTQLGGGTQSPGEIENLLYNIDGAIGIFGSYSMISVDVNVEKPAFR